MKLLKPRQPSMYKKRDSQQLLDTRVLHFCYFADAWSCILVGLAVLASSPPPHVQSYWDLSGFLRVSQDCDSLARRQIYVLWSTEYELIADGCDPVHGIGSTFD
jgi:hypothetical protein